MGRFNEDEMGPRRRPNPVRDLDADDTPRFQGGISFRGVEEVLDDMRSEPQESDIRAPVSVSGDIDYEDIRQKAQHMYFVNANDHLPTPDSYELDIGIEADPEELSEQLVEYLQDDGINALQDFAEDSLEEEGHWINLIGFGLIEGEGSYSNLGEYVTDEVFEY